MLSSPTAAAAPSAFCELLLGDRLEVGHAGVRVDRGRGRAGPHAGVAVGLQLDPHRVGVGARALPVRLVHDAGDVLDVVAVLVGDDVLLGQRAVLGAELGAAGRRTRRRRRSWRRAGSRTGRSSSTRCRSRWPTASRERHGVRLAELTAGGGERRAPDRVERVEGRAVEAVAVGVRLLRGALVDELGRLGPGVLDRAGAAGEVDAGEQVDGEDEEPDGTAADRDLAAAAALADATTAEAATLLECHRGTVAARAASARVERQFSPSPRAARASPVARACATIRTAAGTRIARGSRSSPRARAASRVSSDIRARTGMVRRNRPTDERDHVGGQADVPQRPGQPGEDVEQGVRARGGRDDGAEQDEGDEVDGRPRRRSPSRAPTTGRRRSARR